MDKILRLPEYLKTKIASVDNENYKEVTNLQNKWEITAQTIQLYRRPYNLWETS